MRIDWLPYSAAALVLGATALAVGALLMPASDDAATTLRIASEDNGRWLAVAVLYFLASVTLTLGMPSIVTLFVKRGGKLGLTAVGVFTIGCVGIAGLAMLLAFFGALAATDAITAKEIADASAQTGLSALLFGWIGAFYLGELLLAIALLRARTTRPWIPVVLILHVVLFPVASMLPNGVQPLTALLVTVGLCGVGITANQQAATAVPA